MHYLFQNEVIDYDYFENKEKETILFLHGWGGNKFSFQQTINLLKSHHKILSITFPTILPTTCAWNMFNYVQLVENILSLHSIKNPIIICHSFGCRVAMILNKKIKISKIIITGGAGLKKGNIFSKIIKNNGKTLLKNNNFKYLYKKIASSDYINLPPTNKKTFQNVVNLNLNFVIKFDCPLLLFWGTKDSDTPLWIAKLLKKQNNATITTINSDHFAYLKENSKFNHEVLKFLKND